MNKLTTIVALSVLSSVAFAQEEEISVTATVAWESEYVFRGKQFSETAFQPAVDMAYGGAYAGIWTSLPVNSKDDASREIDIYAGYGAKAGEMFNLDAGVTVYYYPSVKDFDADAYKNTTEIYAGASADSMLSPSLYFYYDFRLEAFTVEGSASHSVEIMDKTSLDLGGAIGYVWADKVNSVVDDAPDYAYGSLSADLTYAFNDTASMAIGGRLSFNSLDEIDLAGIPDTNLWWGVSFSAGF